MNAQFVEVAAGDSYLVTTEVQAVNKEMSRSNEMETAVRNNIRGLEL